MPYNKEYSKNYYILNKEEVKTSSKIYREKNKEKLKTYHKNYRSKNKTELNTKRKNKPRELKLLYSYRLLDKKKNLNCNLTVEWIKDNITNKSCIYCNDTENIGCDRLDNTKGHTMDNCVPCCSICNYVRNDEFSIEEMKELGLTIKKIKEQRKCQK